MSCVCDLHSCTCRHDTRSRSVVTCLLARQSYHNKQVNISCSTQIFDTLLLQDVAEVGFTHSAALTDRWLLFFLSFNVYSYFFQPQLCRFFFFIEGCMQGQKTPYATRFVSNALQWNLHYNQKCFSVCASMHHWAPSLDSHKTLQPNELITCS